MNTYEVHTSHSVPLSLYGLVENFVCEVSDTDDLSELKNWKWTRMGEFTHGDLSSEWLGHQSCVAL